MAGNAGSAWSSSAHRDETFTVETEAEVLTLRLEKQRGRVGEGQPHVRYRFAVIERVPIPNEDDV